MGSGSAPTTAAATAGQRGARARARAAVVGALFPDAAREHRAPADLNWEPGRYSVPRVPGGIPPGYSW